MALIKYLKALLFILIPLLLFNLILSLLYYFNVIPTNVINYLKLVIVCLSMLVGGIYIGTKATKKGWLEGIKVSLEIIVLFFLLSYSGFDYGISFKTIVYYLILLASTTLGSMIGISRTSQN